MDTITNTVATLPIGLYKLDGENAPKSQDDDYRLNLLNGDTNDNLTGYNFKRKITKDLVLYGESVIALEKLMSNENIIAGAYPLNTKDLIVNIYSENGYKYIPEYQYNSMAGSYILDNSQILNIVQDSDNGITGQGVMQKGSNILNLALAQNEYEKKLLNAGAMPSGILQFPHAMNAEVLRQASENFDNATRGAKNQGKTVALEGGTTYTPLQNSPDKMQLGNSKKDMLGQIARLFNLPETMINSEANKYNSNEQNNIQFFQFCLKPILDSITSSLNKFLLLESEKQQGFYFAFNTDSIFQNTLEEKSKSILPLFNNGVLTYNETRHMFGMQNGEGDDFSKFTLGDVLRDQTTGEATIFNTLDSKKNNNGDNEDNSDNNQSGNLSKSDPKNKPTQSNEEQTAKSNNKK